MAGVIVRSQCLSRGLFSHFIAVTIMILKDSVANNLAERKIKL